MATTIEDLKRWIDNKPEGTHHMIVVCDTFDWDDYPVYVTGDEDVREKAKEYDGKNMQKLMEVYSFTGKHAMEDQLNGRVHVFNWD
jgi:hypothetical protein